MELLIKITSEPIQMARFTQNARLVNSDSVDMERRKAIARHMAMRNSTPGVQGSASVTDITRINHAFLKVRFSRRRFQASRYRILLPDIRSILPRLRQRLRLLPKFQRKVMQRHQM